MQAHVLYAVRVAQPSPAIAPLVTQAAGMALPLTPKAGHLVAQSQSACHSVNARWLPMASAALRLTVCRSMRKWAGHACVLFCAPWESQLPLTGHSMRGFGWAFVLCLTGDINCCYLVLEKATMHQHYQYQHQCSIAAVRHTGANACGIWTLHSGSSA